MLIKKCVTVSFCPLGLIPVVLLRKSVEQYRFVHCLPAMSRLQRITVSPCEVEALTSDIIYIISDVNGWKRLASLVY